MFLKYHTNHWLEVDAANDFKGENEPPLGE